MRTTFSKSLPVLLLSERWPCLLFGLLQHLDGHAVQVPGKVVDEAIDVQMAHERLEPTENAAGIIFRIPRLAVGVLMPLTELAEEVKVQVLNVSFCDAGNVPSRSELAL